MAYTDLTSSKKINGLPADLDALAELIDNDAFFKNEVDTDEDLENLDRNITPISDDTYSIGELANRIKEIFSTYAKFDSQDSGHGTIGDLAFSFNGETTGFYRSAAGQISFVSGGNEAFTINGAGVRVKTANNTHVLLESINPGFEDSWGIGADLNGLQIYNASSGVLPICKFLTTKIQPLKQTQLPNGDVLEPSLSWASDATTGLYKDPISPKTSWGIAGIEKLTIDNDLLQFFGAQIMASDGTAVLPSYAFENATDSGLSVDPGGELVLSSNGVAGAKVSEEGFTAFKVKPNNIAGPQTDIEVDVFEKSKLVVDCTLGNVSIIGLLNAEEGQTLHVIMAEAAGILTLKHDDLTATSSMLLKGSTDFVINADYGGIILSYDGGVWREASRS